MALTLTHQTKQGSKRNPKETPSMSSFKIISKQKRTNNKIINKTKMTQLMPSELKMSY